MRVTKHTDNTQNNRTTLLNEEQLVENPVVDWVKDKLGPVDQKTADAREQERAQKQLDDRRRKRDPKLLAKDFSNQNSKSTFYIDNNYDKPLTQAQFTAWFKKSQEKVDALPEGDKRTAAQQKLTAQRYNAIVVGEDGRYVRRGAESLEMKSIKFVPGENDRITNGFFMDPYKYKKSSPKSTGTGSKTPTRSELQRFVAICETAQLNIVDKDGKSVDVTRIRVNDIGNYSVKLGNVSVPIPDWIATARAKKVL